MGLRIIDGGLSQTQRPKPDACIRAEARRRLSDCGYDRLRARMLVTGAPIPHALEIFRLQLEFVASRLLACDPPPDDFEDDRYWPVFPG